MIRWSQFAIHYEREALSGSAPSTRRVWRAAVRQLLLSQHPTWIEQTDSRALKRLERRLNARGYRPHTAARYVRRLRAAIHWAEHHGLHDGAEAG